jgi:hypothetical protein
MSLGYDTSKINLMFVNILCIKKLKLLFDFSLALKLKAKNSNAIFEIDGH